MKKLMTALSLCMGLSTLAQAPVKEIALPLGSQFKVDKSRNVFEVKLKDGTIQFYDTDLDLMDTPPTTEGRGWLNMYVGKPVTYAYDQNGSAYCLVQGFDGFNYHPELSSFKVYTAEAIKARDPKKIQKEIPLALPYNDVDNLLNTKQYRGKFLFKRGWETVYQENVNSSVSYIYRMGAVDGNIQCQMAEVDLLATEVVKKYELDRMDVGAEYVWSAILYPRLKDNVVSGFYSIILLSDSKQPSNYGKLTVVLTSYTLEGKQLLQKKYPIKSLRSPEINFSNGYDFFQMYNVESSDGYTLMVNVYDGRVLFLDENFEIFKEYTWGSGELKGEKVPLEYIYVMNKWLSSITKEPKIGKNCPNGPVYCGITKWSPTGDATYEVISMDGHLYVYYWFLSETYIALIR